jgi:hypothetical protein
VAFSRDYPDGSHHEGKVADFETAELVRSIGGEKREHVVDSPQCVRGRALYLRCFRWKDNGNIDRIVHDQHAKVLKIVRDEGQNFGEFPDANRVSKSQFERIYNKFNLVTVERTNGPKKHQSVTKPSPH